MITDHRVVVYEGDDAYCLAKEPAAVFGMDIKSCILITLLERDWAHRTITLAASGELDFPTRKW